MIGSYTSLLPMWHLAGWTMLHFVWVGSLVAVLAAASAGSSYGGPIRTSGTPMRSRR